MTTRSKWLTVVLLLLLAAILFMARDSIHPQRVSDYVHSVAAAWWSPLAFIALYAVFNVLLVPATILTLTAGAVWGWKVGGLWVLVASTIGSAIPYAIARAGSSGRIEAEIRRRGGTLYEKLVGQGFVTLLLMRLVPAVPYNVLNYAAGFAGIRLRDYLAATFLGTIPGIFIFTYLAESIAAGVVSPREAFVRVLVAGLLLGVLVLGTRALAAPLRRRLGR